MVVALDLSYSMKANDLSPNRLESAKKLINEFISKQNTNRV
ncbi:MAG: VWA domain-containing protein [Patescibacteria group bacterium]|nr:VWA domain-containing protein [Patescibacteria group bacterium]